MKRKPDAKQTIIELTKDAYTTGIAFGHTKAWIDNFAESAKVPPQLLARRVGTFLLGTSSGTPLGFIDNLPTLRGEAADIPEVWSPEMAVVERPHRGTQRIMSTKARKAISVAQKKRWAEKKEGIRSPEKVRSVDRTRKWMNSPDKGKFTKAIIQVIKTKKNAGKKDVREIVMRKNPKWTIMQVMGALNAGIGHGRIKELTSGVLTIPKKIGRPPTKRLAA